MAISTSQVELLNKIGAQAANAPVGGVKLGDLLNIQVYTSSAGAGGAATEAMTLTGLAAGDTILSVSQKTKGANSLPLLGWSTQAANALTGIWSADPGAGAVIMVVVLKAAT